MGEKWDTFKDAVTSKFKKYGPLLVKYGVPLAIGLASGGGGAIAGLIPAVVGAIKKHFNIGGGGGGSDKAITDLILNYSRSAYEKLKVDPSISPDFLEGLQEIGDHVQELKIDVRSMKDDIADLLEGWQQEFGRQMTRNFEVTWDKIDEFKAMVLETLKNVEMKVDRLDEMAAAGFTDLKSRIDHVLDILDTGAHPGGTVDVIAAGAAITDLLDEVAQIAPGSEYKAFERLDTSLLTKGDINAIKHMADLLVTMTTTSLKRIGNETIWLRLGRLVLKMDDAHGAVIFFKAALAIKPDDADVWFNLGIALDVSGDAKGAIDAYRKAIAIKPGLVIALTNLGDALVTSGDVKAAIDTARMAISIKPDDPFAWFILGNALNASGDLKGSIDAYRKSIVIKPFNAQALIKLGHALDTSGDLKGAIVAYRKGIDIDPDCAEVWQSLGSTLDGSFNSKGAIEVYYTIGVEQPKSRAQCSRALIDLGTALNNTNDYKGAIDAFHNAIDFNPDSAVPWAGLGLALTGSGDSKGAIDAYRKSIDIDPGCAAAWTSLGMVLQFSGDVKGGIDAYRKAIEINPDHTSARERLDIVLNRSLDASGDSLQAKNAWEKGMALLKVRNLPAALEAFDKSIAAEPTNAIVFYNRACTYSMLNRKQEALRDVRTALNQESKFKKLAWDDPDFDNIKDDPEFQALVR
jgi:tetratricopeptide (TPR) repeat protein